MALTIQEKRPSAYSGFMEGVRQQDIIEKTASVCPEHLNSKISEIKVIPAFKYVQDNKVLIRKYCKEHGLFEDTVWSDYDLYRKAAKFAEDGKGTLNPGHKLEKGCPHDCGLCAIHKSHSALANMVITNRCDLTCWYCFFYAEKAGYIYEPSLDQIKWMVQNVKNEKPIGGNAIQITGGEPTLREDLDEIIKICKDVGIGHIQLNSNAISIARNPELAKRVRDAGVNTVYMSFDGVTPRTNPKNHWEVPRMLEACRAASLGIVLVPTVINNVNDHEIGDILRLADEQIDILRGVHYQPVSLVGRMPKQDRDKYRITIPDTMMRLEEQTGGEVSREDWYPVPCTLSFSHFIEALTGKARYELSNHFSCGVATYAFKEGDHFIPITRFVDVEGLFEELNDMTEQLQSARGHWWYNIERGKTVLKLLTRLSKFMDKEHAPEGLNIAKILSGMFLRHDYSALGAFHKRSLYIGMMHFQDEYNWEIERIKRCDIHYTTVDPEAPVIPFCTFNVMPAQYRDRIQRKFSVSMKEYEQLTGHSLHGEYYKRSVKALEAEEAYKATYAKFLPKFSKAKLDMLTDAPKSMGACCSSGDSSGGMTHPSGLA